MADVLDIFGDGSCLDLITLDGNVDTVNNGSMTIVGDPATYTTGRYGQAFISTTDTTCIMGSPRIMPSSLTHPCAISFFLKAPYDPTQNRMPFLYSEAFFGSISFVFDLPSGKYRLDGVGLSQFHEVSMGSWHHVCYVCDIVLELDILYIDGVLVESYARADRVDYGLDTMWIGGENFNGTEYRGDHYLDQVRFFDRSITATEVGILNSEAEFGEVFRDRRSVFGGNYLSFLDKRESTSELVLVIFKDRRISMSGVNESFKDRRELVIIENRSTFLDRRLCTANISIEGFLDKREIQVLHLKTFKDRRDIETTHFVNFLDTRDIHKGGGIVFSDRRDVQRDLRYLSFRDIREVETIHKGIVIERINI